MSTQFNPHPASTKYRMAQTGFPYPGSPQGSEGDTDRSFASEEIPWRTVKDHADINESDLADQSEMIR